MLQAPPELDPNKPIFIHTREQRFVDPKIAREAREQVEKTYYRSSLIYLISWCIVW